MQSLQGHFLIATPQMPDPRFQNQVIFMCAHNEEGAMGLVVNNPITEISLADVFRQAEIPLPAGRLPPVHLGGPVEMHSAFILFEGGYIARSALAVTETVYLSRDPAILLDLSRGRGPRTYLFALGYAGWAAGQLEQELTENGWLALPADVEVLFRVPDDQKWRAAARRHGIDISLFGDTVGSA
ncbi:MAG: YqgE/AlgH family protein [Thermodesulfobacteriota bacterium]